MNRRSFLRFTLLGAVSATLPIPKFLNKNAIYNNRDGLYTVPEGVGSVNISATGGVLTPEGLEAAFEASLANYGAPEYIIMAEKDYEILISHSSYFGGLFQIKKFIKGLK